MGQLYPVAGGKIYVGPAVNIVPDDADITASLFTSVSWTEIKGWSTMGSIGDASQLITEAVISSGRDWKGKGTKNAGSMQNEFVILPADVGQIALIAAQATDFNYPIKLQFDDAPPVTAATVTATIAAPGVFTGPTLAAGTPVKFSTTGTLPTGIVAGTQYYVVNPSTNTFSVAATPGGAAITTSGSQTGVHTVTSQPSGTQKFFYGLFMTANEVGGGANTARKLQGNIEINSVITTVTAVG